LSENAACAVEDGTSSGCGCVRGFGEEVEGIVTRLCASVSSGNKERIRGVTDELLGTECMQDFLLPWHQEAQAVGPA
jgi:hypothetical protein